MSNETVIAECITRKEIKYWFKKLINETYGSAVDIQYLPIDKHFNTHLYTQISTSQCQINQVIEFIRNISDMLNYKVPWLNENSYYVLTDNEQEMITNKLKTITVNNYEMTYLCLKHNFIGIVLTIFNFRPDLDDNKKKQINDIFNIFSYRRQHLITYPKKKLPIAVNTSAVIAPITTRMLTSFHGNFLYYLTLQDVFALEIANKQNGCSYDVDLDHDIQHFLRHNFPMLYEEEKCPTFSLKDYKMKDVLYHFINKYHDHLIKIEIPNILNADEVQSLSRQYNINLEYNNIIHVDFKSLNDVETINFCATCHFVPNPSGLFSYDSKCAINYSMSFNADDDIHDRLECKNEFSLFILKSQNNCSPKKSSSILKLIAEHFTVCHKNSILILCEFDLNPVSSEIISSLLKMIRCGFIIFHTMHITYKTLVVILQLSDQNRLEFKECHFDVEQIKEPSSIKSSIELLRFFDMEIELSVLPILNAQMKYLAIEHCRILSSNCEVSVNHLEILDVMWFYYCSIDISTLLKILNGLQCIKTLDFVCCVIKPSEYIEERNFTLPYIIHFGNMIFHIQTLFQMLEKCEIQNRIFFENCSFPLDKNDICHKFLLKPVKIQFHQIKFVYSTLSIILEAMNTKSELWIFNSCISRCGQEVDTFTSTNLIQIKCIQFAYCRLETQTLLKILEKMSKKSTVNMACCDLVHSSVEHLNIITRLPKLVFQDMKLNSQDLFNILKIFKKKSSIKFLRCVLIAENGEFSKNIQHTDIELIFYDMTIKSDIAELLLQIDLKFIFNKCRLEFMTDEFSNIAIQTHISFTNMFFDFSRHLNCLAKFFTPKSRIEFRNCQFEPIINIIPGVLIKPLSILFISTVFDLDVLIKVLERISDQTRVDIVQCDIQNTSLVFTMLPIKILRINFKNMTLELETILGILTTFSIESNSSFDNCKILCSDPDKLSANNLKPYGTVSFHNMFIDAQVFQIFVQKCTKWTIEFENCKIIPARISLLRNVSNEIRCLLFRNVIYSPEILQILQYINRKCLIIYFGELSNQSIIEICTKSPVYGERLRIISHCCRTSFYFELFAEFFRPIALNFKHDTDTEMEYNLPSYLIPDFRYQLGSIFRCHFDWNKIKIKFILVNDVSVKLEFLKDCQPIDLFQVVNDLADVSTNLKFYSRNV